MAPTTQIYRERMSFVMVFSLRVFGAKGAVRTSIGNFCQRRQPYLGIAEPRARALHLHPHQTQTVLTMFQATDAAYPGRMQDTRDVQAGSIVGRR
jgi:hypothetical protein